MRAQLLARSLIAFAGLACASVRVPPPGPVSPATPAPAQRDTAVIAYLEALCGPRLPACLGRVREADTRYGDASTPGWETDRGSVYVQLGDPDQVFVEPHIEIWVYTRYFGRLKFDHQRLTQESQAMLGTLVAQARSAR